MHKIKSLKKITQHLSLLYVEDDYDLRESSKLIFDNLFQHIEVAEDGEIGVSLYDKYYQSNGNYFDIIISDICMPNMDGIELSKKILERNKNQKIIILSAHDDKEYLIELLNNGVTAFMQKPLLHEQIISVFYDVCSELAQEKELFRFTNLGSEVVWDSKNKILSKSEFKVILTDDEKNLLSLFTGEMDKEFTTLEIFEHLYGDNKKEFSQDEIKTIVEHLQEKIPKEIIVNNSGLSYKLEL